MQEEKVESTCYAFADVRGSYPLFRYIVEDVICVAKYYPREEKWTWLANTDTTVICMGNFVHPNLVSKKDSLYVIRAIEVLSDISDGKFITLMGTTEIDLIRNHYNNKFVKDVLVPFCSKNGLMVRWANFIFTHASIESDFLKSILFKNIQQLNKSWKRWSTSVNQKRLTQLDQDDSIINSKMVAEKSEYWKSEILEDVRSLLVSHDNPLLFVHSNVPVSQLTNTIRMEPVKGGEGMVLKGDYGQNLVYFINNQMWKEDNNPQALKIKATYNGEYFEFSSATLVNKIW